jgi:hypothetical protein
MSSSSLPESNKEGKKSKSRPDFIILKKTSGTNETSKTSGTSETSETRAICETRATCETRETSKDKRDK